VKKTEKARAIQKLLRCKPIRKSSGEHRGTERCSIEENEKTFSINEDLALQLVGASSLIKKKIGHCTINPFDILKWPGVVSLDKKELDRRIYSDFSESLDTALVDFCSVRQTEGSQMKLLIENRLNYIETEVSKVKLSTPKILKWQHDRLLSKLKECNEKVDRNRMEQELVILAHRLDVTEELDRLAIHIEETNKILSRDEPIGRRLDFMMQELNRESNTIGSKSIDTDITSSIIQIRVLIEQIREQVQNIE
jgi:uncharacterized protein (TIGR00255 family)